MGAGGMSKIVTALALSVLGIGALGTSPPSKAAPATGAMCGANLCVQHVVVLYMENHSFDNVLGFWCAQTGHCNGMPPTVTLAGGIKVTPSTMPDLVPTIEHSVGGQVRAIDGGKMDGWAALKGCDVTTKYACVSGSQPAQIPNLITLASSFALSDETFSMADSASWAGHLYAVAATTDGFEGDIPSPALTGGPGWGCDSGKTTSWMAGTPKHATVPSCVPDPALKIANGGAFRATPVPYVPTIMDRLAAASLSWKIYTDPSPLTNPHGAYNWATCPTFAECLDTSQKKNMVATQQVLSDAKAGTLPNFSLVLDGLGTYGQIVQHNGMSMAVGDNFIGTLTSALEAGPEWDSTTLFITYDDCGCFYDHVAPGKNPDGTVQGPRSPLVIVSPYAVAGYVDSTPTTFAGILAYVEQNFALAPLSVNDAGAYPFTNSFNYSQVPLVPVPMHQAPVSAAQRSLVSPPDAT
jgi:phospholipase C